MLFAGAAQRRRKRRRRKKTKRELELERKRTAAARRRRRLRKRKKRKKVTPAAAVPVAGGGEVFFPSPAAPPITTQDAPAPAAGPAPPVPATPSAPPIGARNAERLLWRAGFGPRPGDVDRLAAMDLDTAVHTLTRVPASGAGLTGPGPTNGGAPVTLDPTNQFGHDHAAWFDRMVRSDAPLQERMTLVWHDWFATTNADVGNQAQMVAQNALLRRNALGSFRTLCREITGDPAMLEFLNGVQNTRTRPNENYARELMELFTLGADRGAYTEDDVRELAKALTGWRNTSGSYVWIDDNRYDRETKTIFRGTGHERSGAREFNWERAVDACLTHPLHASFFVLKLWSYFHPGVPSDATRDALAALYLQGSYEIRPVVEAILKHPSLFDGPPMVKPPAVYQAGLLRAVGAGVQTTNWWALGEQSGQRLYYPPDVSGWNDRAWLDTSTLRGRWISVADVLQRNNAYPVAPALYPAENAAQAVDRAHAFWSRPWVSPETMARLRAFADTVPVTSGSSQSTAANLRAQRQTALRHLLATSPDLQVN